MESKQEYRRILENPDHVILSDELQDILDLDNKQDNTLDDHDNSLKLPTLIFEKKEFMFQVEKIKRISEEIFSFSGLSPDFPVDSFIVGEVFSLQIFNSCFELEQSHPIEYQSNGKLIFTARRIISNEEISI